MEMKLTAVVALVVIVLGVFFWSKSSSAQKASPDAAVIAQLKKAGSDLSKPHPIEFFLYLPSRESADRVSSKLLADGFKIEAKQSTKATEWAVKASKTMLPNEADLARIRQDLNAICVQEKGEYDGWGTPVVK